PRLRDGEDRNRPHALPRRPRPRRRALLRARHVAPRPRRALAHRKNRARNMSAHSSPAAGDGGGKRPPARRLRDLHTQPDRERTHRCAVRTNPPRIPPRRDPHVAPPPRRHRRLLRRRLGPPMTDEKFNNPFAALKDARRKRLRAILEEKGGKKVIFG